MFVFFFVRLLTN